MKYLVIPLFLMSVMVNAEEMATSANPVPICEKRSDAFSTMLASALVSDEVENKTEMINAAIEERGCIYMPGEFRAVVHKKTKENVQGENGDFMIRYAQISIVSIGEKTFSAEMQKIKFWVAGPDTPNTGVLKLDSGGYW